MEGHAVECVEAFQGLLKEMLDNASAARQTNAIEPPLARSELAELLPRIGSIEHLAKPTDANKPFRYAIIETAVRGMFNELLATTDIDLPQFANIWALLDVVSILSDDGLCDPALGFWLVEELLDSQTIAGCRKVFDYLESRRERMTAKHFKQKELVILRSCKELLRRLSRAEDTAFCGRVYVFMFQSFPLGDKSSVNLRGEYHVENVTTFDELPLSNDDFVAPMEVDSEIKTAETAVITESKAIPIGPSGSSKQNEDQNTGIKSVTFDPKSNSHIGKPLDPDALYPIFWSLQQSFSQPKRLFDPVHLSSFKKGLEETILMFKSVKNESKALGKAADEGKRGVKRKRGQRDDDLANTFNPKYLTSRDLFELEISDLSFRRHILVQAWIIMEFLVSLSSKAKEKLANIKAQNKSVMYQEQILSEEDLKWAIDTKKIIAEYLKQGLDGPFFVRMVETVLSRDKNWVRWKIEGCPSIERPAISTEEHLAAKVAARKATTNKRLRAKPLGSLDLGFLTEADGIRGMERLKNTSRYGVPTLESFKNKIALDEMEIEMPTSEDTKEAAINGKASKSWRALRIASKTKLATFDKIDDPERIDVIFQDDLPDLRSSKETDQNSIDAEDTSFPSDRRPLVISGPSGVGKNTISKLLVDKYPKIFGKTVPHTTRGPTEHEVDSVHYHFVNAEKFNMMRDGDQFLEFKNLNGHDYGISRKAVESHIAAGKLPVVITDPLGVQQIKDLNYQARFVLLAAPTAEELERRLRLKYKVSDTEIQAMLQSAKADDPTSDTETFYEKVVINDDLSKAFEDIRKYVFGHPGVDVPLELSMDGVTPVPEVLEVGGVSETVEEEASSKSEDVSVA